jgi:hypothetical protein
MLEVTLHWSHSSRSKLPDGPRPARSGRVRPVSMLARGALLKNSASISFLVLITEFDISDAQCLLDDYNYNSKNSAFISFLVLMTEFDGSASNACSKALLKKLSFNQPFSLDDPVR